MDEESEIFILFFFSSPFIILSMEGLSAERASLPWDRA